MRIVLDTNVVVSALIWGGVPYKLVQAAIDGDLVLCTSPVLLTELRAVLSRPHLAARLQRIRGSVDEALALFAALTVSVEPVATPAVIAADADDDHVLAAAVAAEADLIVSGDRHLLDLRAYRGMNILTPADALAFIADAR